MALWLAFAQFLSALSASAATLGVDVEDPGCSDVLGAPYCSIGAAVAAAAPRDTVSVAPGTYVGNVLVSQSLRLLSTAGRSQTTIEGVSGVGALGTIQVTNDTAGVQIGGPGQGFTILGIDNGDPRIGNAAVYFVGDHSGARILDNEIVARGDYGLLTEHFAVISDFMIDGNELSGSTFLPPGPGGCSIRDEATLPNVPRRLVKMGGGLRRGNTSGVIFTNNLVSGTAGGPSLVPCPPGDHQGNTLVRIESDGGVVTGNIFRGATAGFASSLSVQGQISVTGNTFDCTGLLPVACHMSGFDWDTPISEVLASNTFDLAHVANSLDGFSGSICPWVTGSITVADASDDSLAQVGETLTYTLTVKSLSELTDAAIVASAPPNTTFDSGSVKIVGKTGHGLGMAVVTTGNGPSDSSLRVDVDSIFSGTVTLEFAVTVKPLAPGVTEISNAATVNGDLLQTLELGPAAIAVEPGISPIPTLGKWPMILLTALLGLAGLSWLRRR